MNMRPPQSKGPKAVAGIKMPKIKNSVGSADFSKTPKVPKLSGGASGPRVRQTQGDME